MPAATREGGVLVGRARWRVLRLIALGIAIVAALAVALGATLSAAHAAPVGTLKQFRVPTADTEPSSITNGSDGNRWFVEGNLDSVLESPAIGRITPAGDITEFPVNCSFCSLSDIVQGPGGILYTSNESSLGRIMTSGDFLAPIDTRVRRTRRRPGCARRRDLDHRLQQRQPLALRRRRGQFTQYTVPEPSDAVVDAAGFVWFTAPLEPGIGRLDPETGAVTVTPTVTLTPRQLTIATDGDIWFAVALPIAPRRGRATGPGDRGGHRVPANQRRPGGHRGVARRNSLVYTEYQGQHRPDH